VRENPTWGEERVAAELSVKLRILVSPRTVRSYWPSPSSPREQSTCERCAQPLDEEFSTTSGLVYADRRLGRHLNKSAVPEGNCALGPLNVAIGCIATLRGTSIPVKVHWRNSTASSCLMDRILERFVHLSRAARPRGMSFPGTMFKYPQPSSRSRTLGRECEPAAGSLRLCSNSSSRPAFWE
jgi:hypothetical protein